ncbi:MAG: hypothetical protein EXR74_00270 [Bdellovibrionales bacterium]|nr:hypothetical protein [Bdellovibrionales bacterium]
MRNTKTMFTSLAMILSLSSVSPAKEINSKSALGAIPPILSATNSRNINSAVGPKIDTHGRFQITSEDGESSFRVGGRLHLDGTIYKNDSQTTMTDGLDARRARLEFQGTMYKNFDWKLDYEFGLTSEIKAGFRDIFIRYRIPQTTSSITFGQFKEFFGLEHMNSSNDLPFVERALPSRPFLDIAEASDGRRLGMGWNGNDRGLFTWALGAFTRNTSGDSTDKKADPFSLQSRITISPIHQEIEAVHLGLNANWIDLNNYDRAKLSSRPESRIGSETLIKVDLLSGERNYSRYALELGLIKGPIWFQGEYLLARFDRKGAASVTFSGWHADLGWVLTGESRVYDFERGTFKNPQLKTFVDHGGIGAFELVARLSNLDYTDEDIQGGVEHNFSSGLNWYANSNYRVMFTWTKVLSIKGGSFDGQTPNEFLFRTQFAF